MKSKYDSKLVTRVQKRNANENITLKQLAKEEGLTAGQLYYILYNLNPNRSHSNREKDLQKEIKKAIKHVEPPRVKRNIKEATVTLRPVLAKKRKNIPGISFFDWLLGRK
tara:strand:+ start:2525 stop:2854 length:330 start_codon:yes stop_codon:yes gene_type:complete